MGVVSFEIILDNQSATYFAGQSITGHLKCVFNSEKKVRGVRLQFLGESRTKWSKWERKHNTTGNKNESRLVHYSGHEEYFKIRYYLIGGSTGEIKIAPGVHTYPFTFILPPNLPSSFEGTHGYVRYTVKAVLDRPWKFDQEYKNAFTVISHCDLNTNHLLKQTVHREIHKTFWFLCFSSPKIIVHVTIPFTGFVPGQKIEINGTCDNPTKYNLDNINFVLEKVVTFRTTSPRHDTKTDSVEVTEVSAGGCAAHLSIPFKISMKVPSLPPSNLGNCNLISLSYNLRVELITPSFHTNVTEKIPIVIGTVPLQIAVADALPPPYSSIVPNSKFGSTLPQPYASAPPIPSPNMPPPSYEQCMYGGNQPMLDDDDNEHTNFLNVTPFIPKYPVYNFTPSAPPLE